MFDSVAFIDQHFLAFNEGVSIILFIAVQSLQRFSVEASVTTVVATGHRYWGYEIPAAVLNLTLFVKPIAR